MNPVLVVATALVCGRLQVADAVGDGAVAEKAAASAPAAASSGRRDANSTPLPPDLPAERRPEAAGCDRASPDKTTSQCVDWATSLLEFHRQTWDRAARETLVRLCRDGCRECCGTAADLLREGVGGPKDPPFEQQLRNEACALGVKDECGVDVERLLAAERARRDGLSRECRSAKAAACLELGTRMWDHDGDAAGLTLFEQACRLGDERGCRRAAAARDALEGTGPW